MDVSPGAAKGRKKRPGPRAGARQALGEGVPLGKMAPRPRLARALNQYKLIIEVKALTRL